METKLKQLMKEKLYSLWEKTDDNKTLLLEEIDHNLSEGVEGANTLLDWCRCDYDMCRDRYRALHNLTEEEMEKIMEENYGTYDFMYDEIPYTEELDNIWDLCNWYLDYCNGDMTEEKLESLIEV